MLGVTEPFSAGIGGGGFMVIRTPRGKVTTIDGREKAPYAMRPDSFFENGAALAFEPARWSGLSAGVPGTVAQWDEALDRYGTMSLRKALKPGIEVARRGFTVDQTFVDQTTPVVDYFNDVPSTAAIYLDPDGTPRDVGSTLRNPDLAKTYELIARSGPRAFYSGPVARAMAAAAQRPPIAADANHVWRPGLMTERDLARYDAVWREPTRVGYKGLDVWGMGPPSSGGSSVGEALNILEGMPLSASDRTRSLHYFLEASRYAFADRNKYLGDPDYVDVPLRCLLSDRFAAERRALITEQAVNAAVPGGDCGPPGTVGLAQEGPSTTHLTVADDDGYVVSYTFTIESTGGNGIVVPGYGFLLNNELTDFNYSDLNAPELGRGRQAAAQLDGADHHHPARAAGAGRRLAGRLDDHHHRPADADRAARARQEPAGGHCVAARLAAQRRDLDRGARVHEHRGGRPHGGAWPRVRDASDRDRRRHRHRVPAPRALPRRGRADPPRRRQRRGGLRSASEVLEHGQQGAGVVDHGVRVRQLLDRVRAGGDRGDAHAVGARARDVARGVADHDGALARPVAGAPRARWPAARRARRGRRRSRPGPARRSGRARPARA